MDQTFQDSLLPDAIYQARELAECDRSLVCGVSYRQLAIWLCELQTYKSLESLFDKTRTTTVSYDTLRSALKRDGAWFVNLSGTPTDFVGRACLPAYLASKHS